MKRSIPSVAALAAAASLFHAAPVAAQPTADSVASLEKAAEFIGRLMVQFAAVGVRSQIEMTYGDIFVDARSGTVAITDIRALPEPPWAAPGACVATVGRLEMSGISDGDYGKARFDLENVALTGDCLPEEPRGMAAAIGYDGLAADAVTIFYDYDLGSSALNLTMTAALRDIADLQLEAKFDYFWFTTEESFDSDIPAQPGEPIADLAFAEIALSDAGGLERAKPMLEGMIGNLAAVPAMAEGGVLSLFSQGGAAQVTAEQAAFAAELRGAIEGLLAGTGDIVVTIDPEPALRLGPELMFDPGAAFAALSPRASGRVAARDAIVSPDLVAAALGGGDLSEDDRLAVGRALATGAGAPYAPQVAIEILQPLADAWNGEAAMIAAEARVAAGAPPLEAYRYALVAAEMNAAGAAALAERLEGDLTVSEILDAQADASDASPRSADAEAAIDAAVASGDVSAVLSIARAAAEGGGYPRHHVAAYGLAALAAAAGDRAGAALLDRIARRYSSRPAAEAEAWAAATLEMERFVLSAWTEGGFAARAAAE